MTTLSVLGVALGIGLYTGVNVASSRAIGSFEKNISGMNPSYNYEVADVSGIDFREEIYQSVKEIENKCLPLLLVNAYIPSFRETVDINGIYTVQALSEQGVARPGSGEVEHFLKNLNSVLVTKTFADRHSLKKGDSLSAYVYNGEYVLRIVDVIDAPLLPANTVLMDLGNFQEYFGRTGFLSRIDLTLDAETSSKITKLLPPNLLLKSKEAVLQNQQSAVDGFRLNLKFLTFLAVLVGVFLLYNTIFISVVKRRAEIGILRALGTSRAMVVALFSAQGLILGFAGSLLGIAFGQVFAWLSVVAVEKTITQFYSAITISESLMSVADAGWTLALGLAISFMASLAPALEAAQVMPRESAREGTVESAYKSRQKFFSTAATFLLVLSGILVWADYRFAPFRFPWLSYAGIISLIVGCTLTAPLYLAAALQALKRPASAVFKAEATIAFGDMRGSRYRFSLALMSVAVSSALIVAILSSVSSLKTSFINWINTYVAADIYVKPASCASNFCFYPLSSETVKTVEHMPGVSHLEQFRSLRIDFHGKKIIAGFGDANLLASLRPNISHDERERLQRMADHREVLISDYLKVAYGLKRGDVIELMTPKGPVSFRVNGTSISYSTMSGFMYFDRKWLKEYWGLNDATQLGIYLAPGTERALFIRNLKDTLGSTERLSIMDNGELRAAVIRIFDRSFSITNTIEVIAIVISLIGVVNALLILVFEKKREISVLRYLGAGWNDIRRIMVLSAGVIGVAGIVLGFGMGSAISIVITHVINRISFGWEVNLQVPLIPIAALMALLFAATLVAGIVPSLLARKIDPKAFISFE